MAPTFTLFNRLPPELRLMVWRLALPDDEPEVFILREGYLPSEGQEAPLEPMTVDTAFPVLMHVCRESRDFALRHGGLRFRSPPEGGTGCDVPFREFRPELDTVFWNEDLYEPLLSYVQAELHGPWLSRLRHLAIPKSTSTIGQHATQLVVEHCPLLETFSIVFPESASDDAWQVSFGEPRRRFKLRRIRSGRPAGVVKVDEPDVWEWQPDRRVTVGEFLVLFRNRFKARAEEVHKPHEQWPPGPGRVLCFAQTFVEWCGGEWVESCARR